MMERLEEKRNLGRATHPRPMRERHYDQPESESQTWTLWDIFKAILTFALGSWICWRTLDILAGGGAR